MRSTLLFLIFASQLACNSAAKRKAIAAIQELPSFKVLLSDSATVINAAEISFRSSLVLIYFKWNCSACRKETDVIVKNIKDFQDTKFLFLTPSPLAEMKIFANHYKLSSFENIVVARDFQKSFDQIFKPRTVPYMVIYNKEKKLIKIFSSPTSPERIRKAISI